MTRIVISRCLGIEATRYNGKLIEAPWLKELNTKAELVPVCPEFEIGLGVPRNPINLVKARDGVQVIQDETELDLSEELVSFSQGYLRFVGDVDAFILKSKSPSCGLGTTKILIDEDYELGSGIFADLASKLFPDSIMVDERYMTENGVDALLELID